jgi:xanthine dehydrogenase accessory factor
VKEIRQILSAYEQVRPKGQLAALATVVHVEGSAYRRPGARMLVTEDGRMTGSISGGCLEGDALRRAQLVMKKKHPALLTYDSTDEDEASPGMGLGCQGLIHVLLEPISEDLHRPVLRLLKEISSRRERAVLITLFSLDNPRESHQGTWLCLSSDGSFHGSTGNPDLDHALKADAHNCYKMGVSAFRSYQLDEIRQEAFIELLDPATSLVIAGAGNDIMPLAGMAGHLGWEITLVDGRPGYASSKRFPEAKKLLQAKPPEILKQLEAPEKSIFLLMTHNYHYDLGLLRELLPTDCPFIGILGPRKKWLRMQEELLSGGLRLSKADLDRIHTPLGLDLGAENPGEIALSILAEIKSFLSGKKPVPLRDLPGPIHGRDTGPPELVTLRSSP